MKKFSFLILFLSLTIAPVFISGYINSAETETQPAGIDIFKNTPLTGFWEDKAIELVITMDGWTVNKINKFNKTRTVHDKGKYASFIDYLGNGKDYYILKLYYEKKDILDDIPVVKLMVNFKKKCLWSEKNDFKVCIE